MAQTLKHAPGCQTLKSGDVVHSLRNLILRSHSPERRALTANRVCAASSAIKRGASARRGLQTNVRCGARHSARNAPLVISGSARGTDDMASPCVFSCTARNPTCSVRYGSHGLSSPRPSRSMERLGIKPAEAQDDYSGTSRALLALFEPLGNLWGLGSATSSVIAYTTDLLCVRRKIQNPDDCVRLPERRKWATPLLCRVRATYAALCCEAIALQRVRRHCGIECAVVANAPSVFAALNSRRWLT